MKSAFTMMELVFVIIIIGILASVAIPKFLGVANQAHEANLKSFVGTLNGTVAPVLWSQSISNGDDGDISYLDLVYDKTNSNEQNLSKYISIPKEIQKIDLSRCTTSNYYIIVGLVDENVVGAKYFIACKDGNYNEAPHFILAKTTQGYNHIGDYNKTSVNENPVTFSSNQKAIVLLK